MKTSSPLTIWKYALSLTMLSLSGLPPVQAALLVYEGFHGYTEGSLGGQTVQNTTGLTGSYYASHPTAIQYQATGLTFSNLAVSGGSIMSSVGTPAFLGVDLSAAATGTIYSAYLIRFGSALRDDFSAARLGINPDADGPIENRYFNSNADGHDGGVPTVSYDTTPVSPVYASFNDAGTFLVLARFTNVGAELSPGTPGVATMWILTEAQFDYFRENGLLNDSGLDAAVMGTGEANVRWRISETVTFGTYTFTGNAMQLSLTGRSDTTFVMDEIRFGATLADVTPVPEPSTAALLGTGALLLIRRGRSRS